MPIILEICELGQKGSASRPWDLHFEYWTTYATIVQPQRPICWDRCLLRPQSARPLCCAFAPFCCVYAFGTRCSLAKLPDRDFRVSERRSRYLCEPKVNPKRRRRHQGRMICVSEAADLGQIDSSGRTTDVQTRSPFTRGSCTTHDQGPH